MNKLIVILLFSVYIFKVLAVSTFIEKGQRPEIFELTDNDIAVFRLTIPDNEFTLLKEEANVEGLTPNYSNLTHIMKVLKKYFPVFLYNNFNFNITEMLANQDVDIDLSGLFIKQDGYPDLNKIMENLDFDPKHYIDFSFGLEDIETGILAHGKYNYIDILMKIYQLLNTMEINNPEIDTSLTVTTKIRESVKNNLDTEPMNIIFSNSTIGEIFEQQDSYNQDMEFLDEMEMNVNKKFKIKNGTLSVNIAGKQQNFDKFTLSLSGRYSRHLVKPNFNIKIRGNKDLFGRSQFKLRSDFTEPTFLRSKLTSDIHKKLGLQGICANYATLYINDEYMGLFVLTDAYKLPWVEQVYGEKKTTSLYKCETAHLNYVNMDYCSNENDDITDTNELNEFIEKIVNSNSAKDIEDIFEVDHFIKEMVIEYLLGAWDHFQLGHNYYLYKQPNGKWIYLTYDHDHSFGINIDRIFQPTLYVDIPERLEIMNTDYPNYSFSDWTQKYHLINILILNDPTRFNQAMKEIVATVFNPSTLFPHIDEIKEFIRPYAEKDYTPDEDGNYPGRINKLGINPYTFEHWEANSEFTSIATIQYNAYGIKYWILAKYRNVCKTYDLECDPIYLDENYKFEVDEKVQFKGYDFSDIDDLDLSGIEDYYARFYSGKTPLDNEPINEPIPISSIIDIWPTPTPEPIFTDPNSKNIKLPPEDKSDSEFDIEDEITIEDESDSELNNEDDIEIKI